VTFPSCNSVTGHAWGWFFQYPNPNTHPPGVALGVGVTVGVAEGVGVTVAVGVTLGVAVGVAVGVTVAVGVGVGVGLPSARAVSTVLVFPVTPSNPATTIRRFPIAVPPVNACATFVFGPLVQVLLRVS
jgi:hypothetical protein